MGTWGGGDSSPTPRSLIKAAPAHRRGGGRQEVDGSWGRKWQEVGGNGGLTGRGEVGGCLPVKSLVMALF